ncbi:unnamed protein product [Withania somnifera]
MATALSLNWTRFASQVPRSFSFPFIRKHRQGLRLYRSFRFSGSICTIYCSSKRPYSVVASGSPSNGSSSYTEAGDERYDVIVVGGGHAGCEASLSSARLGAKTLLLTLNIDRIAWQPCNPAVGGPAKSQLVHEVDALGGEIGKIADR